MPAHQIKECPRHCDHYQHPRHYPAKYKDHPLPVPQAQNNHLPFRKMNPVAQALNDLHGRSDRFERPCQMRFQGGKLIVRKCGPKFIHFPARFMIKQQINHTPLLVIIQTNMLITDLVTKRQKGSMVKAFHRSFTASHDLTDLRIRHVLHKFQDEEILSFRWQASDQFEQRVLLL